MSRLSNPQREGVKDMENIDEVLNMLLSAQINLDHAIRLKSDALYQVAKLQLADAIELLKEPTK